MKGDKKMKKEDLAKIKGGVYIFESVGRKVLNLNPLERENLRQLGYEAVQFCGNFDRGIGGFEIKKDGKFVDPQEALDAYKESIKKAK